MGHITDMLFLLMYILIVVGSFPIIIWVWCYFKIPSLTSVVLGVEHVNPLISHTHFDCIVTLVKSDYEKLLVCT